MPIGVMNNNGIQFSSKPLLKADSAATIGKSEIGKNKVFRGIIEEKTKLVKNDKNEIQLTFKEVI